MGSTRGTSVVVLVVDDTAIGVDVDIEEVIIGITAAGPDSVTIPQSLSGLVGSTME